ncbi:MAG: uncharacterized protein PWP34_1753 [Desulfuromonadales bacterium]|jgi:hypothetical protein|nr:uncharacterized protein [Desulfuromonadales bacterium]
MKKENPSPYWKVLPAAIALAGIIVFIFASYGPPASSSGFVTFLKGVLSPLVPDYVATKQHYAMLPGPGSWLMAFVIGMAIGGFIAGRTFSVPVCDVPQLWEKRFGKSRVKRFAATFAGGFLILFGARLAGGCTLGLFISGSTQLAISGLYFGIIIFAVSMLTARLVYGKTGKGES